MFLQEPNFDFDSYVIVAEIMKQGGNIYAETTRYNYGPIWFSLLDALNQITSALPDNPFLFRKVLVTFLTVVDVGILVILLRMYGIAVAAFFFLNPISIFTTGTHHQFDNLALFLGLCSVLIIGRTLKDRLSWRTIIGLVILGVSLITKHIFFLFPLWLAVKQKGWGNKMIVFFVPPLLFIGSFLPFWREGASGILQNVVLYSSFENAPFWNLLLPSFVSDRVSEKLLFFGALIAFGFIFRKKSVLDSFWLYTACLVIFSSAIANQYFAIVVPFVAIFFNWGFLLFVVVETRRLLLNMPIEFVTPSILFLFVGFLWIFRREISAIARRVYMKTRLFFAPFHRD